MWNVSWSDLVHPFFRGKEASEEESINLIVRLREKEEAYAKRELPVWLGNWCGSHVVIRGAWCEPIGEDFACQLNQKLHELQTEHSQTESGIVTKLLISVRNSTEAALAAQAKVDLIDIKEPSQGSLGAAQIFHCKRDRPSRSGVDSR